jgi:predicted HicB family RNase H-like nuclease
MSVMHYNGYSARVEFDDRDGVLVGRVAGISDGITFHADSVEGLRAAFHGAVDDYLAACAKIGKAPQKAFSGNLMLRVSPSVHANAAMAAELSGKSLNQWSEEVLAKAASEQAA